MRASSGSRRRSAAGSRASRPCARSCPGSGCGGSAPPVRPGLLARSPDRGATWFSLEAALPCCPARGFDDAAVAAAHCRDVTHVAAASRVPGARPSQPGLGAGSRGGSGTAGGPRRPAGRAGLGLRPALLLGAGPARRAGSGRIRGAHAWSSCSPSRTRARTSHGWRPRHAGRRTRRRRPGPRGPRRSWTAASPEPGRTGWPPAPAVPTSCACPCPGTRRSRRTRSPDDWGISVPGAAQLLARWVGSGYRPAPGAAGLGRRGGRGLPAGSPSARPRSSGSRAPSAGGAPTPRSARGSRSRSHAGGPSPTRWRSCAGVGSCALALPAGDVGPPA